MHIHLEEYKVNELDSDIIYFANSVDKTTYLQIKNKFKDSSNVYKSFGIHPEYASKSKMNIVEIEKFIKEHKFVGEIGLDYFWIEDSTTYEKQRYYFELQLKIVKKFNKIPMIHTKGAEKDVLVYLKKHSINNAIIHWYSGPKELIKEYLELGSYFTIGPDILTGSQIYKDIPHNRLFLETDNPTGVPWIINNNYNSKNRAKDIIIIYNKVSELLGLSVKELKILINNNLENIKNIV